MSFILDALRKSESERRRTATPMLAGVPVEVARATIPVWTWVLIGVLGVAVIALGSAWWSNLRTTSIANGPSGAVTDTVPTAAVPTTATPSAALPADNPQPSVENIAAAAQAMEPPTAAADEPNVARDPPPATTRATATDASSSIPEPPIRPITRTLPTLTEVEAAGLDVPELSLELHVYHSEPSARWVYINGGRYTEGRQTAAGPRLVEIVPEGVVMTHAGRDFLLLAQ